jgi:hypothetical protein
MPPGDRERSLLLRAAVWTMVKLHLAAMAHANSTAATYRIPVSGASGTALPQNLNARPLVGAQSCRSMHTAACLQDGLGVFVE